MSIKQTPAPRALTGKDLARFADQFGDGLVDILKKTVVPLKEQITELKARVLELEAVIASQVVPHADR